MSDPDKRCCMLAEITGLLRCCGSVRFVGMNKVAYRLVTENAAVARKIIRLMKEYFDIRMELNISKSMVLKKNHLYEMIITEDMRCEAILRETGILRVRNGFNNFSFEVDESIIKKKCCKRAFLRGVFLGSEEYPKLNELLQAIAEEKKTSVDAVAYAWLLRIPAKMQVITGTTKPSRILEAAKATEITLTKKEWYDIYKAAGKQLP